jgi:hypothetical protein
MYVSSRRNPHLDLPQVCRQLRSQRAETAAALDSSATNSHQRNRSKVHLGRQEEIQRKNNILMKRTYGI